MSWRGSNSRVTPGLYISGDHAKAKDGLNDWTGWARTLAAGWGGPAAYLAFSLVGQALTELGDEELVREWHERLAPADELRTAAWDSVDVFRGDLAMRLELVDEALQHYKTGLRWAEDQSCPIAQGRNLQGLAAVAERRGNSDEARGHLDRAGDLFSRHGARLYLDQVLAKKEILKA